MSDAMNYVENIVKLFSLKEQLHLLAYIANNLNQDTKENAVAQKPRRQAGGLTGKFWMADDFDAPIEDFAEYM
ncbi:MAG: DUF2281 domain-containing protein [Treponema sp.]|nr:DUF2281 domain-containing protein [Treponema sp.]